jgi:serine/threonine-protein kinase
MDSRRPTPTDSTDPTEVSPRRERLDRYVLYNALGRGGMATVYLARMVGERGFERWVAVKRMHEHLLDDEPTRQMFLDEARMAAQLHHPNLVQVTDFGEVANQPYLVMEYIDGETLSTILRRCLQLEDPLPVHLAARIMAFACEGLHHAHELNGSRGEPLNLVHRDVSPQNILVSYEGVVKVTDFGIAKAAGRLQQTGTGQMKGKISYMSPEQVLAQPLDRGSDVFALGIVLYESTLGVRLFRRDSELETLQRITAANVPAPTSINPRYPKPLEHIVLRALSLRREDRYLTAKEMQRELEQYLFETGRHVGTSELSELMESLFAQKKLTRQQMMNAATLADANGAEIDIDIEVELSPTTLSLPNGVALKTRSRRGLKTGALIAASILIGVLLTVLAVLFLSPDNRSVVAEQREPSGPGPIVDASVVPDDAPTKAEITSRDGGESSNDGGALTRSSVTVESPVDDGGRGDGSLTEAPDAAKAPIKARRTTDRSPPGTVSVMARPWCDVYLGGRRLGRTPIVGAQVPSGRRTLRFMPLGKGPAQRRVVTIKAGQNTPVSVDLTQ